MKTLIPCGVYYKSTQYRVTRGISTGKFDNLMPADTVVLERFSNFGVRSVLFLMENLE